MNAHLLHLFVVFSIVISLSCGSPYKREMNLICGSRLVDTMAMVCSNHYNSPMSKKSVNWNLEYPLDYTDDYNQNSINSGGLRWMDNDINTFIPIRHQRGIIEECCKKPCSYAVMRSFCSK